MMRNAVYTERELEHYARDYYDQSFSDLITEFIDSLDVLQKEKDILERQHEFIMTLSHQLRTPISALRAGFDVFADEVKDKEMVKQLKTKVVNLSELIDSMVLYIDAGEEYKLVKVERIRVSEVIDNVLEGLEEKIKEKKIKLVFNKPDFDDAAEVDKKALRRAISFLVDNAVVYNKEGGQVEINIERDKDVFKVVVKDTGYGIPEDEQKKVFSSFFRATNSVYGKNEGSGVSLYLTKLIAEAHGGEVEFISQEGKGSTVSFSLRKRL